MKNYKYLLLLLFSVTFTGGLAANLKLSDQEEEMLKVIPVDQRDAMRIKMSESNALRDEIDETFEEESFAIQRPEIRQLEEGEVSCESCIYGYEIFKYSPSTFAPSNNIPLPSTYILGPGDKIKISYFGNETISLEKFISRDGNLDLPEIGPVPLAGLNFEEARKLVKSRVQQDFVGTDVSITITELRSINVYLLGQAYKPGSYTLSSLSTLTNALFVTGGVNEEGSLRNIELKRNGKTIKVYDFYDFLVFGNSSNDLRLQEGDTIFIPYIENKFEVIGGFKRPYLYEMKDGETLSDVIKLAGGFSFEVGSSPIIELDTVNVASNSRNLLKLDASAENLNRPINNGDVIGVSEIKALMYEYVKLKGEITKPGSYSIRPGDTLLDIINRAGGYTENAYPLGAIFTRESVAMQQKEAFLRNAETLEKFIVNSFTSGSIAGATAGVGEYTFSPITTLIRRLRTIEPVGRQTISADILTLKTDAYKNIFLMGGDELFIPKRPNSVNVVGEVLNTTTLNFDPSFTLENYIEMSGGLTNYADDNNIYIINPDGSSYTHKKSLFKNSSNVLPGSTIVVSRELRTLDGISLAKIISPVLADLATTAAAIAVLND